MHRPNWIFAYASVIGNSHISENIPCQDSCRVVDFETFSIAVVSDGAGSCVNSHIGSRQVSDFCLYHFEKAVKNNKWHLQDELPTEVIWHKVSKNTLSEIREDLGRFSMNYELDYKSLSCTVIVIIAMNNGLLVTHIGDGRAGYCNSNKEWKPIITPFHGELANQTVFITSEIWNEDVIDNYIESNVIEDDVISFCLLSDGCEKASFECNLYNQENEIYFDPNIPYSLFFNPNLKILTELHEQNKSQDEINKLWESFLIAGNEKLRSEPDDKTLILAVKYIKEDLTENA